MKLKADLKGYGAIPDIKYGDAPIEEVDESNAVASRPRKKVVLVVCLSLAMVAGFQHYTNNNTSFIDLSKEGEFLIGTGALMLNDFNVNVTGE